MSNHVFVATPMYGGSCFGTFHTSMQLLQKTFNQAGIVYTQSAMFNESLITRARNSMVAAFLKTEATHLMFIDADIGFKAEHVIPMLEADKDIICGIYPKKEINWASVRQAIAAGVPDEQLKYWTGSFVVNLMNHVDSVTVALNEPLEIYNGGTGFMIIKREVFEGLIGKVPTYTNNVVDLSGSMGKEEIHEFFATSIEEGTNVLLSEDYHLCTIARKHGYKVWAAPWVELTHNGFYSFEGRLIPAA